MTEITAEPTPQQGQKGANTLDYDDAKQTDFAHDDPKAGEITDDTVGHHGLRSVWEETPYKTTLRLFWKGVLVCFLAAFSSFTDGYQIAIVGNIIGNQGFINTMGTATDPATGATILAAGVLSAWTALGSVTQWLGMNIFPYISDAIGRKWSMVGYWIIISLSVACETAANNWQVWTAAKVFQGLGVGAMQFSLQVYITELSPTPKVRGAMLSCFNLWWVIGMFIGTIAITMEVKRDPLAWKPIIYTQWVQVALMGAIYLFILPESPWWHAKKGKHEQAVRTLARLYGKIPNYNPQEEYAVILGTVEAEKRWAEQHKEVPWRAVLQGVNGWRTLIGGWELVAGAFVGQSFLSTYTVYFFEAAGSTDPFSNTCITSGLGIASTIFLITCLDYLGRRRIICYCLSVEWICLFVIGCIGLKTDRSSGLNAFLIFLACLWSVCFNLANGAGWSLVGEVPTARLRARSAGLSASLAVLIGIPLGYGTPYMIQANELNWGLKTCFFFAGLSFFIVVATWFIIPETSGRSPAELDEMFEKKIKPWRFHKHVTEVQQTRQADTDAVQAQL